MYLVLLGSFFIVLIVAADDIAAEPTCDISDMNKLLDCADDLTRDLGFELSANASQFKENFAKAIFRGKLDLDRLCLASQHFETCLGPTKRCMVKENLSQLGIADEDAYDLVGEAAAIFYECRPEVYRTLKTDEDCLGEVFIYKNSQMAECAKTLKERIAKDPENICRYGQEYLKCFGDLYRSCQRPIPQTMCTVVKRSLLANVPSCAAGLTCSKFADQGKLCAKSKTCEEAPFNKCAEDFSRDLGFQVTEDAWMFKSNLEKAYSSGNMTLDILCLSLFHFKQCLGPHTGCFTKENLNGMGFSDNNAYTYIGEMASMAYQCSPKVFRSMKGDWQCIGEQSVSKKEALAQCVTDFIGAVGNKDFLEKLCENDQKMMDCFADGYGSCKKETVHVMCRAVEESLLVNQPQCVGKVSCDRYGVDDNVFMP